MKGLFLFINALDREDGQVENEIQLSGFIVYATLAAIFVHTVRSLLKEKPVILPFISFLSTPQSQTSDADELTKIIVDCISYLSQNYKTRNDITRSVSQGIVTNTKTSLQMRVNNAKSSIYSKDILPRIFENVPAESDKFKKMAVVFINSTACDRRLDSQNSDEEKILLGMNIVSIHQPNIQKEKGKRAIVINSLKNIATVIHKEQRHRPIADEIFKLHMQNNFEEIVLISRPSFHQIWNTGESGMDTQKPYFYTDELIERVRTDITEDSQESLGIDNKKKLFLYFTYTEKIPTVLDTRTKQQDFKKGLSYWMLSLDDLELLNPAVDLSASFLGIFNGISIEEQGKAKSRKNYNYALLYSTVRNLQDIDELVTLLGKREEFQKERKALLTNLLLLHLADNEKYEYYKKRALKIDPYSRTVDAIKQSVFEVKYKPNGSPVPVDFKFNFMAYLSMIFSILNKENLYG